MIEDEDHKNGTILLTLKNRKTKPFTTHNLKNNNSRPHISLEMIENVEEVASFIEMGIQQKLH